MSCKNGGGATVNEASGTVTTDGRTAGLFLHGPRTRLKQREGGLGSDVGQSVGWCGWLPVVEDWGSSPSTGMGYQGVLSGSKGPPLLPLGRRQWRVTWLLRGHHPLRGVGLDGRSGSSQADQAETRVMSGTTHAGWCLSTAACRWMGFRAGCLRRSLLEQREARGGGCAALDSGSVGG